MPDSIVKSPIQRPEGAPPMELYNGRYTWTGPLGEVKVVLDTTKFDFHIDVMPDALPVVVRAALDQVKNLGFEMLSEDECEPELLRGGGTRIYLVPIVPVDDSPLIPVAEPLTEAGYIGTDFLASISAALCTLLVVVAPFLDNLVAA